MISFIGLGNMGALIAEGIAKNHEEVRAYDLSPEARRAFVGEGRSTADRISETVEGTSTVVLCLPGAPVVERVLFGEDGVLSASRPPRLVIDCTSSEPSASRDFAARLAARGIAFVDAPVSGGLMAAREQALTAMVGGAEEDIAASRAVLDAFTAHWGIAGGVGAGHATKAINNFLSSASYLLTSEAVVCGRRLGIDLDRLISVFGEGKTRSQNSEIKFPRFVAGREFAAGFSVGLEVKDVDIAFGIGLHAEEELPLLSASRALWAIATHELGAAEDFTRMYELVEGWTTAGRPSLPDGVDEEAAIDVLHESVAHALRATTLEAAVLADTLELEPTAVFDLVSRSSGRNRFTEAIVEGIAADPASLAAAVGWTPGPIRALRSQARALARASQTSMTLTLLGLETRSS